MLFQPSMKSLQRGPLHPEQRNGVFNQPAALALQAVLHTTQM